MTRQFLPISFAVLVLLSPKTIPSSSSSVKESFFQSCSNSSAITQISVTHYELNQTKTKSLTERRLNSCKKQGQKHALTFSELAEPEGHLFTIGYSHLTDHIKKVFKFKQLSSLNLLHPKKL